MSKAYVTNQLKDAISSGSVELLESAIHLAESLKNCDLMPELMAAKKALDDTKETQATTDALTRELEAATTVPRLVASVDKLQVLINRANKAGMGNSHQVHDAKLRMQKVASLIQLRDKMRFAVEICSPSKMKRYERRCRCSTNALKTHNSSLVPRN